jgi:hypothetical protein
MWVTALLVVAAVAASAGPASAQRWTPPRTEHGHPDLQGNWTNATLTPLQRRLGLGPIYEPADVAAIEGREQARREAGSAPSDPDRPPPEPGNLGAYNEVFFDRGDGIAVVNGEPRTSLITFPSNGRIPPLSPEGQRRKDAYEAFRAGFGEYDHPELRPLVDRCIVYYASSPTGVLGPPMSPTGGYNNNLTVVQNADHVVIRAEMIHDIRIIRLGRPEPLPAGIRPWFGESWGRWEGNSLVVETTRVHPAQGFDETFDKVPYSDEYTVIERLTRVSADEILYEFEVRDPATYSEPWGGQIPWRRFEQQVLEYDCHEGNYAVENSLRGARYQERQAVAAPPRVQRDR